MWEEHPNVFREVRDVTRRGTEFFQFLAFPCNGIDPTTRDVAAPIDFETCQIGTCISNGNECLVSDACAVIEANLSDSGRFNIILVEKINNVLVPQFIDIAIVSTQSIVEVQLIVLDDFPFDTGSDTTKFVSHRMQD